MKTKQGYEWCLELGEIEIENECVCGHCSSIFLTEKDLKEMLERLGPQPLKIANSKRSE